MSTNIEAARDFLIKRNWPLGSDSGLGPSFIELLTTFAAEQNASIATQLERAEKKAALFNALQTTYEQERNVQLSSFWDGGWTVKHGDEINGFSEPERFDNLFDVATDIAANYFAGKP